MKKFFWSLPGMICFMFSNVVSAQNNNQSQQGSYPEFSLRTSLTSFVDYDAGIMLGVNYRWSHRFSASLEPTWIFYSPYVDGGSALNPSGFKIRADLRYHFSNKNEKYPEFFIAPEFHYKHSKSEKEALFGINCLSGQCAYFQNAVYTDDKKEIGGLLKLGLLTPPPFVKNRRWLLELYIGAGVKNLSFKETNLPVGGSFVNLPRRTPFGQRSDNFALPMLPAGFKLIFIL